MLINKKYLNLENNGKILIRKVSQFWHLEKDKIDKENSERTDKDKKDAETITTFLNRVKVNDETGNRN